jgi:toxin ParE1/3/4
MSRNWIVRLTHQAELDVSDIIKWTAEQFGELQADQYVETISLALEALTNGPETPGVKNRNELGPDICTLHIARHGRKASHFVVFRVSETQVLDILRILHDRMELSRHIPDSQFLPH